MFHMISSNFRYSSAYNGDHVKVQTLFKLTSSNFEAPKKYGINVITICILLVFRYNFINSILVQFQQVYSHLSFSKRNTVLTIKVPHSLHQFNFSEMNNECIDGCCLTFWLKIIQELLQLQFAHSVRCLNTFIIVIICLKTVKVTCSIMFHTLIVIYYPNLNVIKWSNSEHYATKGDAT